jgi:hypothetical protein
MSDRPRGQIVVGKQLPLPNYRGRGPRSCRQNCCDPRDDADHGRDERGEVGVEAPEGGVARIAQSRGLPIVTGSSTALVLEMQIDWPSC